MLHKECKNINNQKKKMGQNDTVCDSSEVSVARPEINLVFIVLWEVEDQMEK